MPSAMMSALVSQNSSQDAGIAMVERAHGVKGVGRVAGAGGNSFVGRFERSIRVAEADADPATRGFADHV
jgi:hypothetical protein